MNRQALFLALALTFLPASAQELIKASASGSVVLMNSDLAVLESGEPRTDLPCAVSPVKPELGFDLKLHAGYRASVPFEEVPAGTEMLVIARIRRSDNGEAVHLRQRIVSSPSRGQSNGIGEFAGFFAVGEGGYDVDWMLRDRAGRVCSHFWKISAEFPDKDKAISVMNPGRVQPLDPDPYHNEPLVEKNALETLPPVAVLLNFAPLDPTAAFLSDAERDALLAMLRAILRDHRIGNVSLTVFNLEQRKVLHREQGEIDFREIQTAVESLQLGTISAGALENRDGSGEFVAGLIDEIVSKEDAPAAVVFVGPAGGPSTKLSGTLAGFSKTASPQFFYLTYNPLPAAAPWTDIISKAVRFLKGRDYSIGQPRDLLSAWSDMMGRIVATARGTESAFQAAR
jgi:hypothetical protein